MGEGVFIFSEEQLRRELKLDSIAGLVMITAGFGLFFLNPSVWMSLPYLALLIICIFALEYKFSLLRAPERKLLKRSLPTSFFFTGFVGAFMIAFAFFDFHFGAAIFVGFGMGNAVRAETLRRKLEFTLQAVNQQPIGVLP